jgi:DNA-directed RNA polymerase specialized sigma24 family protein
MQKNEKIDLRLFLEKLMKDRALCSKYEEFAGKIFYAITKNAFARAYTPKDIISNIICKLLTKTYNWKMYETSWESFIHARIKSEIINIVKHEQKFIPIALEDLINDFDEEDNIESKTKIIQELIQEPDFQYPDEEDEEETGIEEIKEILYALFKDSLYEFCVIDEILKSKKPRQIAAELGLSRREVRNTFMRIRRSLFKWCNENNHKALLNKLLKPVKKNNRKNNRRGGVGSKEEGVRGKE